MRKLLFTISAGLLLAQVAAAEVSWLPVAASDLSPPELVSADQATAPESLNNAREAVAFSWPMADQDGAPPALAEGLAGHTQESRQYWIDTTAEGLAEGIELPLSAPGAVVRISPREGGSGLSLNRDRLELELDGRPLDTGAHLKQFAGAQSLQEARMPVPNETVIFRLDESVGAGKLAMRLDNPGDDRIPMVVHVYEPESDVIARMELPRTRYLAGEPVQVRVDLEAAGRSLQPGQTRGMLVSPDAARTVPMEWSDRDGTLNTVLPLEAAGQPGTLWEVHVYLEGEREGLAVMRDVQIALASALPTARLNGQVATDRTDESLELGVEVSQAGRYQISGVIYGTDREGNLRPAVISQFAHWLEPGQELLELPFDRDGLSESGFTAPWEVRDLRLSDQGRLSLLQYQARALVVSE